MIIRGTRENDYGVTPEFFKQVYLENEGFDREASRNTRTISRLDEVMLEGGKLLVSEDPELVEMLLCDTAVAND